MEQYVFEISIILMLSFLLIGITQAAAWTLRFLKIDCTKLTPLWLALATLIALMWILAWTMPNGGA